MSGTPGAAASTSSPSSCSSRPLLPEGSLIHAGIAPQRKATGLAAMGFIPRRRNTRPFFCIAQGISRISQRNTPRRRKNRLDFCVAVVMRRVRAFAGSFCNSLSTAIPPGGRSRAGERGQRAKMGWLSTVVCPWGPSSPYCRGQLIAKRPVMHTSKTS